MTRPLDGGLRSYQPWSRDFGHSLVANTDVSPYFMVYGAEAMLPADIEFRSPRVENYKEDQVTEQRELEVNSAEERRLDSCICTTKYLAAIQIIGIESRARL
jgi:hypothetical protein